MPSVVRSDAQSIKREVFNTTVASDILAEFKANCKQAGLPMNVVIEAFMYQYNRGAFVLGFSKAENRAIVNLVDDVSE